ncbi:MAG: SAM-dependent methyltransferase [Sphingomonadales bacterium]|nr:MAG: SAM-dependent methyltransferase [Sphingomonadales bacterium]
MSDSLITYDRFLGGAVTVVQPAKGYRAGMDAVLLAASLSAKEGESLAEAGSGAGAALLCAAHRLQGCHVTGFERDAGAIALAGQGIAANEFGDRADVRSHDVAERPSALENVYDQAFSNPPFFDPAAVRAPAPGKAAAYLAETPLKAWILFLHHITKPGGRITMIHRAAVLADLLELLSPRVGEIEVLPIRPTPGAPAGRVLIRGRKGLRRGPVTLYDGLALHDVAGGPFSSRAAACFDGAALGWK